MELEELIQGCLKNDSRCQENFFKLYYPKLMAVSIRMTPNREIAEELVQTAFIKIFKKLGTLTSFEPAVIYSWCKVIVTNTIIDNYRRKKNYETSFDDLLDDSFDLVNEDNENDYLDSKNISSSKIMSALQNLPPKYNLVFNLHVIDGYTHPEISEILNINVGTSKSNLSKAKLRLRKELTLN